MKKLIAIAALAATAVATPAFAGSITAEVRLGDIRSGSHPDSTEYRVAYDAPINSLLSYGAEVEVKQVNGAGALDSKVSAKVGPNLPKVLGFDSKAYAEFGQALHQGDDYVFWGAGVGTSHTLYGPVSASFGYRHRQAFKATGRLDEDRLNAGLGYDLGHGNVAGVNYYRTTGTTRADAIGLGITHSF